MGINVYGETGIETMLKLNVYLGGVFCVLFACVSFVGALTCDGDGPCRCTYSDGSGTIDISSIGRQDGQPRFSDEYSYDQNAYSYNPCFSFSKGSCKDSAACKKVGADYVTMGSQSTATWSYTGYYPQVTYTSSDNKRTEVLLMCDRSYLEPRIDVIGELTSGVLGINLFSNCACPNTCKRVDPPQDDEGLSTGSILLIIVFVTLIVYLVGGSGFNYYRNKTVGKEMLPNYNFWALMPGLIMGGFKLSWDTVCRRNRSHESI